MTDLTALTPSEVDVLWAEARAPYNQLWRSRNEALTTAARYEKHGRPSPEYLDRRIADLTAKLEIEDAVCEPYRAEWDRRGGWSRAWVVPDGHIHRSCSCYTLHPTTLVSWLPEQSGWDEDQIVEAAGIHACTVCYPTAPVEALRAAAEAAKRATQCPGSGTYDHDSSGLGYASPRARCNHCRQTVSATSTGKLRAHKPAAVKS